MTIPCGTHEATTIQYKTHPAEGELGSDEDGLGVVGVGVHGRPQQVQPRGPRYGVLLVLVRDFHREVVAVRVVPYSGACLGKRGEGRCPDG